MAKDIQIKVGITPSTIPVKVGLGQTVIKSGGGGTDGFSPIATVEQTENGAVITTTDKTGTTTATVTNGATGPQGPKGDTGATGPAGSDATVTTESIRNALGFVPTSLEAIEIDINDNVLGVPVFYACDGVAATVIGQMVGKSVPQYMPANISNMFLIMQMINPRVWFAYMNGTQLELSRLSASINASTQSVTLYLRGRTSIASGIMGIDTAWTVTPN